MKLDFCNNFFANYVFCEFLVFGGQNTLTEMKKINDLVKIDR